MPGQLPRCMFALVGLTSCPGYQARWVAEATIGGWYHPIPAHRTCEHLRTQTTERGIVSGCAHPLGLAATWWHGRGPGCWAWSPTSEHDREGWEQSSTGHSSGPVPAGTTMSMTLTSALADALLADGLFQVEADLMETKRAMLHRLGTLVARLPAGNADREVLEGCMDDLRESIRSQEGS